MTRFYIPIGGPLFAAFLLAGCAEFGARVITDATYLAESAEGLVRENHDIRRDIRTRCRDRLWARIDRLDQEGREDEADRLLDANYPSLLTFQVVKAYKSGEGFAVLDHPWGCRAALLPEVNVETGLLE